MRRNITRVIDEWVGKSTLAERLEDGPWPVEHLPRLLLGISRGLQALHDAKIIFRELSPARVLISDRNETPVLTDFELGKLLESSHSVSSAWPEDPYRAPEVDAGEPTIRSDLFSLGKVALTASAGGLFADLSPKQAFDAAKVPNRVSKFLLDCLKPTASQRPTDLGLLTKDLGRWAENSK